MCPPDGAPDSGGVRDGLLMVDKPAGWTSHDVVGRARRLCHTRRVGHAGTLDPMATGVLVLGVNRATKLLTFLVGSDKSYEATIRLGQSTLTDDAEGELTASADVTGLTRDRVRTAVAGLTGDLMQVPSTVSAIKIRGRRSYARARAGEDVEIPARPVTVSRFEIRQVTPRADPDRLCDPPRADGAGADEGGARVWDVDVAVDVSSGTYVRALARDLGTALGVGGHLTSLRRTRVGVFTLSRARTLETLEAESRADGIRVVSMADAAREAFPVRQLTEPEARALGYGQRIGSAEPGRLEPVAALGPDGRLVAMLDESRKGARSLVVLAPSGGPSSGDPSR